MAKLQTILHPDHDDRDFLVVSNDWKDHVIYTCEIRQFYADGYRLCIENFDDRAQEYREEAGDPKASQQNIAFYIVPTCNQEGEPLEGGIELHEIPYEDAERQWNEWVEEGNPHIIKKRSFLRLYDKEHSLLEADQPDPAASQYLSAIIDGTPNGYPLEIKIDELRHPDPGIMAEIDRSTGGQYNWQYYQREENLPFFLGREVTGEPEFSNCAMAIHGIPEEARLTAIAPLADDPLEKISFQETAPHAKVQKPSLGPYTQQATLPRQGRSVAAD